MNTNTQLRPGNASHTFLNLIPFLFAAIFLASCGDTYGDSTLSFIRDLVDSKAGVNFVMENQYTPLTYSIRYGHLELTKQLLQAGADPNLKDGLVGTPLTVAALRVSSLSNPMPELVTLLLKNGADPGIDGSASLRLLARSDDSALFLQVLGAGADPFAKDDENRTLLHQCALGQKNKQIWNTLIRLGLDPTQKDNDGFLAIDYWQAENR